MTNVTRQPAWLSTLNRWLAELCGWLLIIVMAFICVDLVTRGLSKPLYGVSEMAMFTMIAIVYLGLSRSEETRSHINVDFLLEKLPPLASRLLNLLISLISVVTIGILLWALWGNAASAFESKQAIAGPQPILIYPVKFVMTLSVGLYLLQAVLNGYANLMAFKD